VNKLSIQLPGDGPYPGSDHALSSQRRLPNEDVKRQKAQATTDMNMPYLMVRYSQIVWFSFAVVFLVLTLSMLNQAFSQGLALDYLKAATYMILSYNFFHVWISCIYFDSLLRVYEERSHWL